jgi:hypothetical protein
MTVRDLWRALVLVLSAVFWWALALFSCRSFGPLRPTELQRPAEPGR